MLAVKISYFLLSATCLLLIYFAFNLGLKKAFSEPSEIKKTRLWVVTIVVVWIIIISIGSISGFFSDFDSIPPKVALGLVPPMVILLIWTIKSKKLKVLLGKIPVHWIIGFQSFRVIVEIMLWKQYDLGITPIQMTFEGRNFDILVGLTAPIMAYLYWKKGDIMRNLAIIWNFIGLGLLLNVIVVAILSFPTPFRYFMNEPSNEAITTFPFILLPALLVTMAYTMHYFSLKQLLTKGIHKG